MMLLAVLSGVVGAFISMTSKILTKKTVDLEEMSLQSVA